jgi:hypothetical protein
MLFAGTAHYPLRSSAPSNAQALTASHPDRTFQFFPNRNRAAMRWSVMLGSLLEGGNVGYGPAVRRREPLGHHAVTGKCEEATRCGDGHSHSDG